MLYLQCFTGFPYQSCTPDLTTTLASLSDLSHNHDMGDWTKVGENLVKHVGGTIYLRAKVKGKVIRVSLNTSDIRIAKIARDHRLQGIRSAAVTQTTKTTVRTLGQAVDVVSGRLLEQPHLKAPTIKYYEAMIGILNKTLPVTLHARTWTAKEAAGWWQRVAAKYAPQRANNVLGVCKQVGKLLVELGIRLDDPTAKLKRVSIPDKESPIPSREDVTRLIESIRSQKKSKSEESADYVAFLSFAGCRHGQAKAFLWEHDEGDWLKFPAGVTGTKGASTRRLPISPPLRTILDRIKSRCENADASLPIFKIATPRIALDNACERLGISHLRIHDLRHFFATHAIESGVDIPTVAKWLGHKDGGRLLMKRYSHLRDDHSLASAAKLAWDDSAPVSKPAVNDTMPT